MTALSAEDWYGLPEPRKLQQVEARLTLLRLLESGKHPLSFTRQQGKLAIFRKTLETQIFQIFDYEKTL